jgi:hypothetical protein
MLGYNHNKCQFNILMNNDSKIIGLVGLLLLILKIQFFPCHGGFLLKQNLGQQMICLCMISINQGSCYAFVSLTFDLK